MNPRENNPLHIKGEMAFAGKCDEFGCEYLHIKQESGGEFSDKMRKTGQKRPDFLINIPDLTSLFVDVKVRERRPAGEQSQVLRSIEGFYVKYSDLLKMRELERRMRICTWYAFFAQNGDREIYSSSAYLIPISRVEKHLTNALMEKLKNNEKDEKWEIRIPESCMNKWESGIDLQDKCQGCKFTYCKEFPK
jgi:hypothetical protein